MDMSSRHHVILITGANRGIGFAVVHSLAMALPSSTLLLGCRDTASGEAAISELRSKGISSTIVSVQLDVTNDDSVKATVGAVAERYGRLDVLINNAGYAAIPPDPGTDAHGYRAAFQSVYDVNVTGVALCMALFLPLLRKSEDARVVNVSSGRASMQILALGEMPPTVSIPYSISKVALNALTVEMSRCEENSGVVFLVVGPGHCKTAFNGYRGVKNPMEGAVVVVECVVRSRGEVGNAAFWETRSSSRELVRVPW
jgi:NAD(P)-dependent dehydrogenase (short-subunit alcohol dehydrogenase family)